MALGAVQKKARGARASALAEINITPMVDVMLVLLIIFMVTAPLLQQGLEVDVPKVNSNVKTAAGENDLVLTLTKSAAVYLGDDKSSSFSLNETEAALQKRISAEENFNKVVFIKADRTVPYGHVARLMGICKNLGIEKVGMITQAEDAE